MNTATGPTSSMQLKGIQIHFGVYTNNDKKLTCIPATDTVGLFSFNTDSYTLISAS